MSLGDNCFYGRLDSLSHSSCSGLRFLNLTFNYFVGELPDFGTVFADLETLDLSGNNFTGKIPAGFGNLPSLKTLLLSGNLLNGSIPEFITNLTELTRLELSYNPLTPGPIPRSLGNLKKLKNLLLTNINLIGNIPESIGKLMLLKILDLSMNNLSGEIPRSIGGCLSLEKAELYDNKLSGILPENISNLLSLRELDVSENNLTGKLPEKIWGTALKVLNLNDNNFEGEVSDSIALNHNLQQFKLFNNRFSGELPKDLGHNSKIIDFDVSGNRFEGQLPPDLCSGNKLENLIVFENNFSGNIPESYVNCSSLSYIRMSANKFSGSVPVNFWSLSGLQFIQLEKNEFKGSIPSTISRNLNELLISGNNFSGEIPKEICELKNLVNLDLSRNKFSGQIPTCITKLRKLQNLELQENEFEGVIPKGVGSWRELNELNISNNKLTGEIPIELGNLPVLTYLSLEDNSLSGEIPIQLTKLRLNKFNVSNNKLQGKVPTGFDNSYFLSSLIGNPNLCSPNLKPLHSCSKSKLINLYIVATLAALAFVSILSIIWIIKAKTLRIIFSNKKCKWNITSFQRVDFNEDELLASLTDENLIGSGGSGRVYKVKLKSGQTVAIKQLWAKNKEEETEAVFDSEINTLGRIRHANVIKLLMSCRDEDFRVLVYEYMENGSLGDLLHNNEKGGALLDWPTRYSIAIGTAKGLMYLHHCCSLPIVHRDIKSNNILLDGDFRPLLADFGLAKILQMDEGKGEEMMSRVAGSYGYIAPEYSYTMKVNERSDIYSYGVVLLELITGKRPNDDSFGDHKDIVRWVTEISTPTKFEENNSINFIDLEQIIDPRINRSTIDYEEVNQVLSVALLCTSPFPMNRPSMRKVVELFKERRFASQK